MNMNPRHSLKIYPRLDQGFRVKKSLNFDMMKSNLFRNRGEPDKAKRTHIVNVLPSVVLALMFVNPFIHVVVTVLFSASSKPVEEQSEEDGDEEGGEGEDAQGQQARGTAGRPRAAQLGPGADAGPGRKRGAPRVHRLQGVGHVGAVRHLVQAQARVRVHPLLLSAHDRTLAPSCLCPRC